MLTFGECYLIIEQGSLPKAFANFTIQRRWCVLMKVDIALLPKDVTGVDLSDTVCIVLDIFRATTSIVTCLANGCAAMIPVLSTEDASKAASKIQSVLFAGERQSIKIEGYDFGNSPFEFSEGKVKDQKIVMTTTNGTIAIKATQGAYRTLIGSLLPRSRLNSPLSPLFHLTRWTTTSTKTT